LRFDVAIPPGMYGNADTPETERIWELDAPFSTIVACPSLAFYTSSWCVYNFVLVYPT
jgi:hypothetical protein